MEGFYNATLLGSFTKFFLVSGQGVSPYKLVSFDLALLHAGVGDLNIVRMSSILPPACTMIEPVTLDAGSLVPMAYASRSASEETEAVVQIASAVAVAIPEDGGSGLIMEATDYTAARAEEVVKNMVELGMQHRQRRIKEVIVSSIEATTSKLYTTVFSAVVLVP